MKFTIGLIMFVGGVLAGLYVGIWVCFVGGIMNLIEFAKDGFESYKLLGWGVTKIMLSGCCGWITSALLCFPGLRLIAGAKE